MLSLIEQIKAGKLWDFHGGIHPPENKKQSTKTPLEIASIPNEIILPLKQHIGKVGRLQVKSGTPVLKGQPLTKCDTAFTVPVHAPTSGIIKAIEPRTVAHPSGLSELCVVIEPDFEDKWLPQIPIADYRQHSPEELVELIRQAGISGMGGAGFPTARKIESGQSKIDVLIINAAECEPYITADDALMREHADEIIQGIEIVEHILLPKLTVIGIEDNKPEAIKALDKAASRREDIVIRVIPTKYPSGAAKQLIKVLTNLEVPDGGRSTDIGQMVLNVGTIHAIKRAIYDAEPLIQRVVTLTGNAFRQPKNVWARLGTPIQSLLDEFGYKEDKRLPRLIMGGPLMGFSLPHGQVPITKIANCILAPTRRELAPTSNELACIRCGACAEVCPASLLPQQLYWHAKAEEYDKCKELNLKNCIECGACAYVCPSEIPLVHYYRKAKAEIRTQQQEASAAERAKERFEERKERLEREKNERANRFKKAADTRRHQLQAENNGQDAIAAAIARVKEQKSAQTPPQNKPAVAAAIARAKARQSDAQNADIPDNSDIAKQREERKRIARERKAEKEHQDAQTNEERAPESTSDKKSAVAAAVARAKARKAQQNETADSVAQQEATETKAADSDPKKAAIAAAVARAKARKTQQNKTADSVAQQETTETKAADSDPKKAAIAAAVARAKARKAQQNKTADSVALQEATETKATDSDPKKAAIAAAVARAKARKAQQNDSADSVVQQEATETKAANSDPKKAAIAAAVARAKARKAQQLQNKNLQEKE
ncbi:electron transport complex subunit RsxC [Vibrio salinus]|uniref:electron transport complex subunit RsxC n=1 Tax=Vibrio salinus TaxID=2899784 RepID=UPI001E28DAC0|nr:electron transport complex subunit RsxC [Vibrio salinus]MCE0492965.1 electron transport complex subunit RsxC [Vibrio salinus]